MLCSVTIEIHAVFTAVNIQVEVFRVVKPCSVVVGYQRFGGPCCLHLQGEANGAEKGGIKQTEVILLHDYTVS
jgi:hypothetical protein